MKKKLNYSILVFSTLLILLSCKNHEKSDILDKLSLPKQISYIGYDRDSVLKIIDFIFPDTVNVNKQIGGELKYDLRLDTIEPSEIIERYIYLYTSTEISVNVMDIEKKKHKIFLDTIGDGTFNFNIKFDNLGNTSFTLILQDNILMKSRNSQEKMDVLTDEIIILRNVYIK